MKQTLTDPPSLAATPRWAASRDRLTCSLKRTARLAVRDVFREARRDARDRHAPVDPWHDCVIAGRSGNGFADFTVRAWQVLHTAGECPHRIKARLTELLHRVADATHLAHHRA